MLAVPRRAEEARTRLGLYRPGSGHPAVVGQSHGWKVDGYPARILVWTDEEYRSLSEGAPDAQRYDCGVWVALRID